MQETGVRRLRKMSVRNFEKSNAQSSAGIKSLESSGRPAAKSRTGQPGERPTRKRRNLVKMVDGAHVPMIGVRRSGWCVYELRDSAGSVLYVGMSNNPARRVLEHAAQGRFPDGGRLVEKSWHGDTRTAQIMERAMIRHLNPPLNRRDYHSPIWSGPFIEKSWAAP